MKKWIAVVATGVGVLLASHTHIDASHASPNKEERVVLLHGLARSADSMTKLADALKSQGYEVCNIDYPSREHAIDALAAQFVAPGIARCFSKPDAPIHFVTHSLGGIVVRQLAAQNLVPRIGRVVMLSPPNHGSEVVDKLGDWQLFDWLNGPAGRDLGTQTQSAPMRLGPATFEVGIIAGARTINPLLSMMIPGDDDGKVSIENAKLAGMRDFIVVSCSHPFIMKSDRAIEQTLPFLREGAFRHASSSAEPLDCWD